MIAVDEYDRGGSALPAADPSPAQIPAVVRGHSRAVDEDSLSDEDLRTEIELVAELVLAASASDRSLSRPEIDRILGIGPAGQPGSAGSGGSA